MSILNFNSFINEAKEEQTPFQEFALKRLAGATKIAEGAKKKGGLALLTYHHFVVKLPYYKKAAAGKFNYADANSELLKLNKELAQLLEKFEPKDQTPFQKIMGKIEVIGELLIRHSVD
jgi:hypothetical protein